MKRHDEQAPDPAELTLWIDGELNGDDLARVESWAKNHPEYLVERDAVRAMKSEIRSTIPASVEPPYADFFNQRIMRTIEDGSANASEQRTTAGFALIAGKLGKWLALPATAAAMLICFYIGTQVNQVTAPPSPVVKVSAKPTIYMPDGNVRANIFSPANNAATVIVLEGLEDIPDDFEIVGEPHRGSSARAQAMMVSTEMIF
ncbi:MAG: anti-sigma factor family protein [Akkermansiaceae bacterium]